MADFYSILLAQYGQKGKANSSGVYPDLGAGDLVDDTTNGGEFTFGETNYNGKNILDSVKGNTIVWNQIVKELNSTNWTSEAGITPTYGTNEVTLSNSGTANNGVYCKTQASTISGHKYFITATIKSSNEYSHINVAVSGTSDVRIMDMSTVGNTDKWVTYTKIVAETNPGTKLFYCYANDDNYSDLHFKNVMIIDITLMFGSTVADYIYALETNNAGDGVAYFRSFFNLPYYPYDTGSLLNFNGNALLFNQLIYDGDFTSSDNWKANQANKATLVIANNVATLTCDSKPSYFYEFSFEAKNVFTPFVAGHKYFLSLSAQASKSMDMRLRFSNMGIFNSVTVPMTASWSKFMDVITADVTGEAKAVFNCKESSLASVGDWFSVKECFFVDLTMMYGIGNEPTLEEFKAKFPNDYYPYTTCKPIPYGDTLIKSRGFNQWDEEWTAELLNSDGTASTTSNRILTDYIPVVPNMEYECVIPYVGRGRGAFYDASKNLISYFDDFPATSMPSVFPTGYVNNYGSTYGFEFITPPNAYYVRYNTITAYGNEYKNDICISLYGDGTRAGEYEPYEEHTLKLPISKYFPDGMKSAGSVYDELTRDKAITRIGAVDMGTLTWHYNSTSQRFYAVLEGGKPTGNNKGGNAICPHYDVLIGVTYQDLTDKTMMVGSNYVSGTTSTIVVYDSAYTSESTFTTAMDGIILYYEMDEPVETPTVPKLDMSYPIVKGGTQELIYLNEPYPTTTPLKATITTLFKIGAVDGLITLMNSIAPVETSPTENAYSSGDYLIWNYQLYRVTSSISAGGTLTVGTNITATTVMSELLSLTA